MSLRTKPTLGIVLATIVASLLPAIATAQALLDPVQQPKFVNPLPIAARIDATAGGYLEIDVLQVQQHLGVYDPVTGQPLMTTVWGYGGSYPGPTIVVRSGVPLDVRWTNGLIGPGGPLPHLLPVDTSIHWAEPENWPECGVPLTAHVHGGHTESASDGLPDSWFTPGFAQTGPGWVKEVLHYDNTQEAATIWYHDHVLGMTRLNVYAGLAGFYLIRDDNEDLLVQEGFLPTGPYEIEMAIQDKMFTADGDLYYASEPEEEEWPEPSHLPEFFGDVMLVNAKAWPVLEVEPRQYRFRFVNGCDSRFIECFLTDSNVGAGPVPKIYHIGTDSGFLNAPVRRPKWVQGPGERMDMVFDFSDPALWGRTFILRNTGKTPYPNGDPVDASTTGQIMAFQVTRPLDTSVYPPTALPVKPDHLRPLYGPVTMPVANAPARNLILFEGMDEHGRLKTKLGTVTDGAMDWDMPITENPMVDDTEVWHIYNTTVDAHPIHLHLVSFRVISRQAYKATTDSETGKLTNIKLHGKERMPSDDERGWKDTVIMYPGEVTSIIATFDREGLYVWHCHIVSHEDHEMMRPFYVGSPLPPWPYTMAANSLSAGTELTASFGSAGLRLGSVYPNPFNPRAQVRFEMKAPGRVDATIYDVGGRLVRRLVDRDFAAGTHVLEWNGVNESGAQTSTGVYFLRLHSGNVVETRRLVLIK